MAHTRPPLPVKHANPLLKSFDTTTLPPVKYQTLDRDGQEVLVGRMKIPTPQGHAFILRRFDTGAVSLTTMFRAAFPNASEQEERRETQWVKEASNLSGNNGSVKEPHIIRLAGTWVGPDHALSIAHEYNIHDIVAIVVKAQPDPNIAYRRSSKAAGRTPEKTGTAAPSPASLPSPPPTVASPNPPKRRREASPARVSPAPAPILDTVPVPAVAATPLRRSTRTKSPTPSRTSVAITSVLAADKEKERGNSARKPLSVRREPSAAATLATPAGSDETVVADDDADAAAAGASAGPETLMAEDVAEQRELIAGLKAQRTAALTQTAAEGVPAEEQSAGQKRVREETEVPLQFEFREPEVGERQIATNSRVRFQLGPRQRSLAWGAAAFAVGLGAIAFLPNFL